MQLHLQQIERWLGEAQKAMLRITVHSCSKTLRLIVEGRLEGAHVVELENCWQTTTSTAASQLLVDLTGVTFINCGGKQLLARMHEQGARLVATGIMTKQVIEEVRKDATR